MKKAYDLSAIMTRAWSIRKTAADEIGCKASEVLFSVCLRMAWAEAEGQHASINADSVVAEWASLNESEQVRFMTACIRKAAKNEIGFSSEDHYLQFSEVPAWGLYGHGFDEFVSETWLRLSASLDPEKIAQRNERRAEKYKSPLTLVNLVYNAARASIAAIFYADTKHSAASVREISDDDGNTSAFVEIMANDKKQNTERQAMIRHRLNEYRETCDHINRQIFDHLQLGYTEREIAGLVKISNVAVHKRIVKMRSALEDLREYVA